MVQYSTVQYLRCKPLFVSDTALIPIRVPTVLDDECASFRVLQFKIRISTSWPIGEQKRHPLLSAAVWLEWSA